MGEASKKKISEGSLNGGGWGKYWKKVEKHSSNLREEFSETQLKVKEGNVPFGEAPF